MHSLKDIQPLSLCLSLSFTHTRTRTRTHRHRHTGEDPTHAHAQFCVNKSCPACGKHIATYIERYVNTHAYVCKQTFVCIHAHLAMVPHNLATVATHVHTHTHTHTRRGSVSFLNLPVCSYTFFTVPFFFRVKCCVTGTVLYF